MAAQVCNHQLLSFRSVLSILKALGIVGLTGAKYQTRVEPADLEFPSVTIGGSLTTQTFLAGRAKEINVLVRGRRSAKISSGHRKAGRCIPCINPYLYRMGT